MQSYNSTIIIPEIPLEDIDEDLPIYLYVGLSDDFTSVEDVQELKETLNNVEGFYEYDGF